MTNARSVLVGERDHSRLLSLLARVDPKGESLLYDELDEATVTRDADLPPDVVTMESTVTFRDTDSGEESTVTLVYPPDADTARHRVSVLAPVGAALIGLRVGETIAWPVPSGRDRHLEVVEVVRPAPAE
jgi:regulator of nucleoside diphosphate kinase